MRFVWICSFLLALAACSAPTPPPATNGASAAADSSVSQAPPAATPSADDGWQLDQKTSPMDGKIIQAQRTYQFANDSDMVAQVQFNCMVQKHQLVIKIGSYVGGTGHPTKASAYQTSVNPVIGSLVPDGRVKFGTFDPVAFASYFNVGSFANIAEMNVDSEGEIPVAMGDNGVVDLSLGGMLGYYAKLKHIHIDGRKLDQNPLKGFASGRNAYNKIAAFSYLFPIAIEIVNGRGTFDFVIDKSSSIDTVLNHCDTGEPVVDSSLIMSDADVAARNNEVAQAEQQKMEYQAQQAAQTAAKMKWENGENGVDLLYRAVESYLADHNDTAPTSLQDLLALPPAAYRPGTTSSNGFHAYVTSANLIDPFGHPYGYVRGNQPWMFHVYFYGEDGVPSGAGLNSDCVAPGANMMCRILPETAQGAQILTSAPVPTGSTAPPASARVGVASVDLGSAVGPDEKVTQATTTFTPKDTIYASVSTTGSGIATLDAKWTYQDGQTVEDDSKSIAPISPANTTFSISKPDGWPIGNYKVEISLNGTSVASKDFSVK